MKWYLIGGGVVVLVVVVIILLSSKKQNEKFSQDETLNTSGSRFTCDQWKKSEWGYNYEQFYKDCKDFQDKSLDDNIKYVQTLPNDYTSVREYAHLTNEYALKKKYISKEEYNNNEDKIYVNSEDKVKEFTIDLLKNIYNKDMEMCEKDRDFIKKCKEKH
tara:strand:+ start:597 stop:1076 length:480 start_codon:yes stop_codon:yes gene_type:complete